MSKNLLHRLINRLIHPFKGTSLYPFLKKPWVQRTVISAILLKKFFWLTAIFLLLVGPTYCSYRLSHISIPETEKEITFYANQNGNDLRLTYIKAIESAKESILFIIYTLRDPLIIRELKKKAEEGVKVTVILDADEARKTPEQLGKKIETISFVSKGLMHQKILVIDDKVTWIGSANMTYESLKMHDNLIIALYLPELAKKIDEKAAMMRGKTKERGVAPTRFSDGVQQIDLMFLPEDKEARQEVKKLIQSANKTVRVAMFTFTAFDLATSLVEAKKKGIEVAVVIDRRSLDGVSKKAATMLLEGSVSLFTNRGSETFHHKFLYIDQETLLMGSANWTNAAFKKNDEVLLLISPLTLDERAFMDALWDNILKGAIKVDSLDS